MGKFLVGLGGGVFLQRAAVAHDWWAGAPFGLRPVEYVTRQDHNIVGNDPRVVPFLLEDTC